MGSKSEYEKCCEACGDKGKLIWHHWYDMDETDELPFSTVNSEPRFIEVKGRLLYYHERNICLKCNRLLIQSEIRYFKGGGIKPFKYSDGSHIMPPWSIQKTFAMKVNGVNYARLENA